MSKNAEGRPTNFSTNTIKECRQVNKWKSGKKKNTEYVRVFQDCLLAHLEDYALREQEKKKCTFKRPDFLHLSNRKSNPQKTEACEISKMTSVTPHKAEPRRRHSFLSAPQWARAHSAAHSHGPRVRKWPTGQQLPTGLFNVLPKDLVSWPAHDKMAWIDGQLLRQEREWKYHVWMECKQQSERVHAQKQSCRRRGCRPSGGLNRVTEKWLLEINQTNKISWK